MLLRGLAVIGLTLAVVLAPAAVARGEDADPGVDPSEQPVSPVARDDPSIAEAWSEATRGLEFGSSEDLVAVWRIGASDPVRAERFLAEAEDLFQANRTMEAAARFVLAIRRDPRQADAFVGLGRVARRHGRLNEAIASFRTALDRDGANVQAKLQLALALWNASRYDEAIARMNELVAAHDELGRAHERLAVWYYYRNDDAAAMRHLQRAEQLGEPIPTQLRGLLEARDTR